MRPRALTRAALLALALAAATAGCAVGRLIVGAPPPRARAAAPAPGGASGGAPGQALLARRCAGCHEAPDPAAMSAAEWSAGLERMKRRMRLPESEWDSLAAMPTGPSRR